MAGLLSNETQNRGSDSLPPQSRRVDSEAVKVGDTLLGPAGEVLRVHAVQSRMDDTAIFGARLDAAGEGTREVTFPPHGVKVRVLL